MSANTNDLFSFDEDEEEVELSTSKNLVDEIRQAVVFTIDWSVGSLLEQLRSGSIDLQPQYQRRDAWTVPRKSRLVESLILGLPVPQLVLAERHDEMGSFLVLDGKQRLTALLQFAGGMPTAKANSFRLTDLPVLSDLNGKVFAELDGPAPAGGYMRALLNQPVRTVILRNWKSDELLHLVFHRLNSNVVPLSPQELRQALIMGPFLPFLNDFSADSTVVQALLRLSGPDFRMRDSELLLRLLAFSLFADDYRGDLRRFLDNAARRINHDWDSNSNDILEQLRRIEGNINIWATALGGHDRVGRRYRSGKMEPRFNRAILDAQVAAAFNPEVRQILTDHPDRAAEAFNRLQQQDNDFARSIESTTKTIDAVKYRNEALQLAILAAPGSRS